MTAPRPGDRVRISYEGKWSGKTPETGALGYVEADMGGWLPLVPRHATVEILPTVYVNSDATEYRDGDVVVGDNESHVYMRVDGQWIGSGRGNWYEDNVMRRCRQVRLLVRDGQVVQ